MNLTKYSRATLVGVALTSLLMPSSAGAITGNDLLRYFDESRTSGELVATTYVAGVRDAFDLFNETCVPGEVTNGQLTKIVHKYLKKTPESLHVPAAVLVYTAAHQAFPCPTKP